MNPHALCSGSALALVLATASHAAETTGSDVVHGELIEFTDNGAWSWFQDERAIADPENGLIIVGSVANADGPGGAERDGDIQASVHRLADGTSETHVLKAGFTSYGAGDDHNLPAFLLRPDGKTLAVYAGHNNDNISYYRVYDPATGQWSPEHGFDWGAEIPGGTDFPTTYSNLFHLSDEGRIYNFARTDRRSPNLMVSEDGGDTWRYGGQLAAPDESIGYVNGYFKYSSNGRDRIDFIATEFHPRDFNTSVYHGFVKGGASHRSDGTVLDPDISDKDAPKSAEFTPVFKAGTPLHGKPLTRWWTTDLQVYPDGTITALVKARLDDDEQDHHAFYGRFDGTGWSTHYLAAAGGKLYRTEQDYTGLGALHPHDPDVVFVSTPIDPRDGSNLNHHELFRAETTDAGATWSWFPLTERSSVDNLRPIATPIGNENRIALLWLRGTYNSAQSFDSKVVGTIIEADDQ